MARSIWKGAIALPGTPITLNVETFKATDEYAGREPLKEICECHHKPFTRARKCVEGGSGGMVKGIEKEPGVFIPVDTSKLEGSDLEALALIDSAGVPWEMSSELWHLAPAKKVPGSDKPVEAFYAFCEQRGKVLMGKLSNKGKQHVVAIHAARGVLCMTRIRFEQEVREPSAEIAAVGRAQVSEKLVEMLESLIDLPTNFNLADMEDVGVEQRAKEIAAALAGEPAPTVEGEAAPTVVRDLEAELEAAIAASGTAKPKPTKAKAKVTA